MSAAAMALMWLVTASPTQGASKSKKEAYLASKADASSSRHAAASEAIEVVYARNLHTHEVMPLEGPGIDADAIDEFLRCHFTSEEGDVPAVLLTRIRQVAHRFDARKVHIVSGFRHPKYNTMLRKKGREVALTSQHTQAHAVDFTLVGVPTKDLYRYLLREHQGGVGYYPRSGFVHIDTGRKRTWKGR